MNRNRRRFLSTAGAVCFTGLAGCTRFTGGEESGGSGDDQTTKTSYGNVPPVLSDRPDEPYYPTHVEGMEMAGKQTSGDYACALTFTFPHRFWLVTGTNTRKVVITKEDSVHLMPVVWHTGAKLVPPDVSPQVEISKDGETVTNFAPWPMLSQPMGFHFGDNVALDGDGTYTVTVDIGTPSGRRSGGLEPNDPLSFEFEWSFRQSDVDAISYRDIGSDREGLPGAVPPMDMMTVPMTQAPEPDDLPGSATNLGTTNGAVFHATIVDDASAYGGTADESYLVVSPRTKYNRFVLPMMSLSATLEYDGTTIHDGPLPDTLDPEIGYHYGTTIDPVDGDASLSLTVDAPPQTARHEGYETAFVDLADLAGTL